jgi:general secretion pathway protein G
MQLAALYLCYSLQYCTQGLQTLQLWKFLFGDVILIASRRRFGSCRSSKFLSLFPADVGRAMTLWGRFSMFLNDRKDVRRRVRPSTGEDGYTLVEILVVLAIIALIMGLVGPRVISYLSDSKTKAAGIQIKNLASALELYYLDTGQYPSEAEGLSFLVEKPQGAPAWNGPYLKTGALPADPWGNPYRYRTSAKAGAFEIISLGADGQEGGTGNAADITTGN